MGTHSARRNPGRHRIPSHCELEQETGGAVSRRTIKSAIEVLQSEGLVQGVQGKGVFVVAKPD
ncbi:GntR family transcriptional regulator [Streptomyces sp. NPDC052644]